MSSSPVVRLAFSVLAFVGVSACAEALDGVTSSETNWIEMAQTVTGEVELRQGFHRIDSYAEGESWVERFAGPPPPQEAVAKVPADYRTARFPEFGDDLGWQVLRMWTGPAPRMAGVCSVELSVAVEPEYVELLPKEDQGKFASGDIVLISLASGCSPS